jgi:putative aminopeptidase FrvX
MKDTIEKILNFGTQLLAIPSPSGYTEEAILFCQTEAEKLGYKTEFTKKGNLIITVPGLTSRVLGLSAHVDTLGAMVRSITPSGDLKFTPIGGPSGRRSMAILVNQHTKRKTYQGPFYHPSVDACLQRSNSADREHPIRWRFVLTKWSIRRSIPKHWDCHQGDYIFFDPRQPFTPSGFIKKPFSRCKFSVCDLSWFALSFIQNKEFNDPKLKI